MKKIIFLPILIIVVAIFSILIISINNGVNLAKLNSMNHDINVLEDSIALYYLNNGNIPIKDKINFEHSINPNDNNSYYKIELSKLESIYLNYGKMKNEQDFYIINEESHTIYYFSGVEYKGKIYYTKDVNYTLVED